jgi:hypothetical protein
MKVPGGGAFPKSCAATLVLAEKDNGDLVPLVTEAYEKTKKKMEEMKNNMDMGADEEPPSPDIWDTIWEESKKVLYEYVKDRIVAGLRDDVFDPQLISLSITSDDFRWPDGTKMSPETTVEFRGHGGVYYVVCYWEVETLESIRPRPHIPPVVVGGNLHPPVR